MDNRCPAVTLFPFRCYLYDHEVTLQGCIHASASADQICDRRTADHVEGHRALGRGPSRGLSQGDPEGTQGLSSYVSGRRRGIAATQIHHWSLRPHHAADGAGSSTKDLRGAARWQRSAEEKKQTRRRLVVDQVEDLIETFIRDHVSQTGTSKRISSLLRRDVVPYWGTKSIHEIKKRDVSDFASKISQRKPTLGTLLKTLKTFFRWCVGRAVIDFSPAEGIVSSYRETSRDRVLTDDELTAIILAARETSRPYGPILEFLALTGQRREEVAELQWNEIDEETHTWSIPGSRTKNKKAHIVHLSEQAWTVVETCPAGDFVFATSRGKHFQGFRKGKEKLDELSGITGWRLHDLRRTVVSGMARLGVPPHVADKVLNHQAGTISGVAAVYQRHDFLAERKDALDRWGAHVEQIVGGKHVPLRLTEAADVKVA